MFYDDVFQSIMEDSAFSQDGVLLIDSTEHTIKGFFCSGNYGEQDYDRGYTTKKTEPRQSFKISLQSLPARVASSDLVRQKLSVNGKDWIVRDVVGNDSGILSLDLVPMGEST